MNAARMRARALAVCLAAAMLPRATHSQLNSLRPITGAGARPCATWTQARDANDTQALLQQYQWVLGFLSGYNEFKLRGLPDAKPNGVFPEGADVLGDWITGWCRQNPYRDLYEASLTFVALHHGRRPR